MAAQIKEGDSVVIVDRVPTPADEKNGTFFAHFCNLTGTLEKLYPDGLAAVVVDLDALPEAVAKRHKELTSKAKKKWLDGLSDEARNRLTTEEKQFEMRYTVLLKQEDVRKAGTKASAPKSVGATAASAAETPKSAKPISTTDLDKAEEEALKARAAAAAAQKKP